MKIQNQRESAAAFFWNMVGSACYSLSSILYLMMVTRICGAEEAGFFSLAYATAQLLLTVGRYGMRTYQATDLRSQYSFCEYAVSRVITVALMLLLGAVYSAVSFAERYVAVSMLVIAMKALDAVEDVYHGRLQQTYHVEQMGKSQAIRNAYTAVCFMATLLWRRDLLAALEITVLSSLLLCVAVNEGYVRCYAPALAQERRLRPRAVGQLLVGCTGIFVGTFLSLLLYNIPKYAMAGVLSAEYQTYYSILFMPSFVVTLLCEFVFKPTITTIAGHWMEGRFQRFTRSVMTCLAVIAGCGVCVVLGGHLIGRRLLELLYGVDLSAYWLHFIVLLIGGGVSAGVYMLYNILIAIRHGGCIKIVYGVVAAVSIAVVRPMIVQWGMMGAALNYLLSCSLLLLCFGAILLAICRREPA